MSKTSCRIIFLFVFGVLFSPGENIFAQEGKLDRVAILACHRQNEPAPALERYLASKPDLCLWIGDNIYADTRTNPNFIDSCYQVLAAKPAFQQLKQQIPYLATWDDHDYGLNDAGKEYAHKAASKDLFRRFWNLEQVIPANQEGIYYARTFAIGQQKLQVIMLDVRYNRDAPDTDGDVLGAAQWQWLEQQLRAPADLRLVVSGFQILLNKEAGSETWDFFPSARARLFQLIRRTLAEGVVFLTGDQHYAEVCREEGALDYPAIELQFAGINQTEAPEKNRYRVSPVGLAKHSYALLDIQWEENDTDEPHLLFRVFDASNDQVELTYRVNFREIHLSPPCPPREPFVESMQLPLASFYPQLALRYTLDGSAPHSRSRLAKGPLKLRHTTTIKAQYFDQQGLPRSGVYTQTYERLPQLNGAALPERIPGLRYAYREGRISTVAGLDTLPNLAAGLTQAWGLDQLPRVKDHFGLIYEGYFEAPEPGLYTFELGSDDGAQLWLHGKRIVNNDGSHSFIKKKGQIQLTKGWHPLRIAYFDDTQGQRLALWCTYPGGSEPRPLNPADFWASPLK